jgi:hypothetical protein
MKIIQILAIIFILTALFSGCSSKATTSTPPLSSTSVTSPINPSITLGSTIGPHKHMLEVLAVLDKPSYLPGETVGITLTITNVTAESLTLNNYPYTVEIYRDFVAETFFLGSGPGHLTPGETRTYNFNWDQSDEEGTQVNPAVYWIRLLEIWITEDSSGIQHGEGYIIEGDIIINYPQGAMQKTITVYQSQAIDDVTITLTRVELTATGMSVYMEKIPVPPLTGGMPAGWFEYGSANFTVSYRFDDGRTFQTDIVGWLASENYVAYTCTELYPAPSNAQTLFFTIDSMTLFEDGTYGPFEFEVPLQ